MHYYFLLIILLLTGCQTGYYQGSPSDHFDGTRFYNPEKYKNTSIADNFKQGKTIVLKSWRQHIILPELAYNPLEKHPQKTTITFVNHATVLIQTKTINILTDPIWSYRASPFTWIGPARVRKPGIEFSQLPPIDVVLISHNHYDHMDLATLKRLNDAFHPLIIVPLGNKVYLANYKLNNVVELDWWQHYKVKNAVITFFPARHWSARWFTDVNRTLWGSYGIALDHKKIYFAGDTGYANHFKDIYAKWGAPDIAFMPIGAYLPRFMLKDVHMDPQEAIKASQDLHSHYSMGIHFGTFELGDEDLDDPPKELAEDEEDDHIPDGKFFVLNQGHSWFVK